MQNWILLMALTVAALSLAAAGIVCRCCRKMRRDKDRRIVQVVREQDGILRELEHVRIEKQTLERLLSAELGEAAPTERRQSDTEPTRPETLKP